MRSRRRRQRAEQLRHQLRQCAGRSDGQYGIADDHGGGSVEDLRHGGEPRQHELQRERAGDDARRHPHGSDADQPGHGGERDGAGRSLCDHAVGGGGRRAEQLRHQLRQCAGRADGQYGIADDHGGGSVEDLRHGGEPRQHELQRERAGDDARRHPHGSDADQSGHGGERDGAGRTLCDHAVGGGGRRAEQLRHQLRQCAGRADGQYGIADDHGGGSVEDLRHGGEPRQHELQRERAGDDARRHPHGSDADQPGHGGERDGAGRSLCDHAVGGGGRRAEQLRHQLRQCAGRADGQYGIADDHGGGSVEDLRHGGEPRQHELQRERAGDDARRHPHGSDADQPGHGGERDGAGRSLCDHAVGGGGRRAEQLRHQLRQCAGRADGQYGIADDHGGGSVEDLRHGGEPRQHELQRERAGDDARRHPHGSDADQSGHGGERDGAGRTLCDHAVGGGGRRAEQLRHQLRQCAGRADGQYGIADDHGGGSVEDLRHGGEPRQHELQRERAGDDARRHPHGSDADQPGHGGERDGAGRSLCDHAVGGGGRRAEQLRHQLRQCAGRADGQYGIADDHGGGSVEDLRHGGEPRQHELQRERAGDDARRHPHGSDADQSGHGGERDGAGRTLCDHAVGGGGRRAEQLRHQLRQCAGRADGQYGIADDHGGGSVEDLRHGGEPRQHELQRERAGDDARRHPHGSDADQSGHGGERDGAGRSLCDHAVGGGGRRAEQLRHQLRQCAGRADGQYGIADDHGGGSVEDLRHGGEPRQHELQRERAGDDARRHPHGSDADQSGHGGERDGAGRSLCDHAVGGGGRRAEQLRHQLRQCAGRADGQYGIADDHGGGSVEDLRHGGEPRQHELQRERAGDDARRHPHGSDADQSGHGGERDGAGRSLCDHAVGGGGRRAEQLRHQLRQCAGRADGQYGIADDHGGGSVEDLRHGGEPRQHELQRERAGDDARRHPHGSDADQSGHGGERDGAGRTLCDHAVGGGGRRAEQLRHQLRQCAGRADGQYGIADDHGGGSVEDLRHGGEPRQHELQRERAGDDERRHTHGSDADQHRHGGERDGAGRSLCDHGVGGSGLSNYAISYVNAPVGLTVNTASLTITAGDQSKTYGTVASLGSTSFSESGLVTTNGDTLTGVTLTSPGTVASATVLGGPYAITPSAAAGSGLSNYAISYVNAPVGLTVNTASLTITAGDQSKTYGTVASLGSTSFSESGLVTTNGDTLTGVTLTSPGTVASATVLGGPYAITPSAAAGSGLSNYAISYVNAPVG